MSELIKDKNKFLISKNYKEYKQHKELLNESLIENKTLIENIENHRKNIISQKENIKKDPFSNDLFEENKELYKNSRELHINSLELIKNSKENKKLKKLFKEIKEDCSDIYIKKSEDSPLTKLLNNISEKVMNIKLPNKKILYMIPIISSAFLSQQIMIENNMSENQYKTFSKLEKSEYVSSINNILESESLAFEKIFLNTDLKNNNIEENIRNRQEDDTNNKLSTVENELEVVVNKDNILIVDNVENIELEVNTPTIQHNFTLNELKVMSETNKNLEREFSNKNSLSIEDLNIIGRAYGIPDRLLYGVYMKESQGRNDLVSSRAAVGPFQFLKETARDFSLVQTISGKEVDLRRNPFYAADASARYIRWLFELTTPNADSNNPESFSYALAAYNAGLSRVKNQNGLRIPPFKETMDYVELIVGFSNGNKYIVERGDTMEKIAEKTGIESNSISSLNNGLSSRTLIAGSFINVREDSPYIGISNERREVDRVASVNINSHRVSAGDTLYRLSRKYNVSVNDIMDYNNLEDHSIKVGQELIVAQNDNNSRYRIR